MVKKNFVRRVFFSWLSGALMLFGLFGIIFVSGFAVIIVVAGSIYILRGDVIVWGLDGWFYYLFSWFWFLVVCPLIFSWCLNEFEAYEAKK